MTVTTVPEISVSRVRASSAVPWNENRAKKDPGWTRTCDIA